MSIKFINNKDFGRWESDVVTPDGYFAKFIIVKTKNHWELKIHSEAENCYVYTAWFSMIFGDGAKTKKEIVDFLNEEVNLIDTNRFYCHYLDGTVR